MQLQVFFIGLGCFFLGINGHRDISLIKRGQRGWNVPENGVTCGSQTFTKDNIMMFGEKACNEFGRRNNHSAGSSMVDGKAHRTGTWSNNGEKYYLLPMRSNREGSTHHHSPSIYMLVTKDGRDIGIYSKNSRSGFASNSYTFCWDSYRNLPNDGRPATDYKEKYGLRFYS
ncbi:BgTH12-07166 [Blumeria graminis f. sp. triticale]|uniref:BgTH12-07166 n=1 Tax=Blumeria graminis f. sp. triticale TaxID=1689686 RepID=A0A9W4D913_BLUGR|nr:BgTH12-07166 [Blumeria graminis f. sp. triticale]